LRTPHARELFERVALGEEFVGDVVTLAAYDYID
jgi:hypothetical protein